MNRKQLVAGLVLLGGLGGFAGSALGQTSSALILTPWPKEQAVDAKADAFWFPNAQAEEGDDDLDMAIFETDGRFRIQPGQAASPLVGYSYSYYMLDGETDLLPDRLVDVAVVGGAYLGRVSDWVIGVTGGVGYSGDAPFGDGNAWYGKASVGMGRQIDEVSRIAVLIDYDGNRLAWPDVPLPGFAYNREVDKTLLLTVGVPVNSIRWKPNEKTTLLLTWLLIDRLDVYGGYEIAPDLTLFAGLSTRRDAFTLESLGDDRLMFLQRRVAAGVQYKASEALSLRVAAGWAFDQEFDVGFDTNDTESVTDLADTAFVQAGLAVRF